MCLHIGDPLAGKTVRFPLSSENVSFTLLDQVQLRLGASQVYVRGGVGRRTGFTGLNDS